MSVLEAQKPILTHSWSIVQMKMTLFQRFAMVALRIRQTKQALLEKVTGSCQ
jgi:hypothetical protein